jgi:hypothetical protein
MTHLSEAPALVRSHSNALALASPIEPTLDLLCCAGAVALR